MLKRITFSIMTLITIISLLTACGTSSETIDIDNDFAKKLHIDKVESDRTTPDPSKNISDVSKVKETLSMVDGLEVEKADENTSEILESNRNKNPYIFSFFKKKMETGKEVPYSFVALEDGTFIFTHDKVDSVMENPFISVETHKDLLNKLKNELDIDF